MSRLMLFCNAVVGHEKSLSRHLSQMYRTFCCDFGWDLHEPTGLDILSLRVFDRNFL
jgi:hypothetical protein